jgi:hypothetical protein
MIQFVLIVLGLVMMLEAIGIIRSSRMKDRARAGQAAGALFGAFYSKPSQRLENTVLGSLGGTALGAFYPYISFLIGFGLTVSGISFVINGLPKSEENSDGYSVESISRCGVASFAPKKAAIFGSWTEYSCMNKKEAGSIWNKCLKRNEYSQDVGTGCQGNDLCCPQVSSVTTNNSKSINSKNRKNDSSKNINNPNRNSKEKSTKEDSIDKYLRDNPSTN